MQDHRIEPPPFDAVDPAGPRLTREAVIEIHKAHLAGVAWNDICREYDIARHNLGRILRGQRWRDLHPKISPELYDDSPALAPSRSDPVEIVNRELREARDRILRELRDAA